MTVQIAASQSSKSPIILRYRKFKNVRLPARRTPTESICRAVFHLESTVTLSKLDCGPINSRKPEINTSLKIISVAGTPKIILAV